MSILNEAKPQLSTGRYPHNGGSKNGNGNGNGNGKVNGNGNGKVNGTRIPAASQNPTLAKNLIALLSDESPQRRLVAVHALSEMGDPSAIEPLKALLRHDASTEVPETAIQHAIYSIEMSVTRARNGAVQELLRLEHEERALRQRIAELEFGYGKVKDEQPKANLRTGSFQAPRRVVAAEQNGAGDIEDEIRSAHRHEPLELRLGQGLEELKVKIGELRRETLSSEVSEQTSSEKTSSTKRYCSECQTRVRPLQMTCRYCGERLLAGFLLPVGLVLFMFVLVALLLIFPTR
jgi:hypothetical protein